MPTFHELSIGQLRQALQLREQIETMQQKLDALLGGGVSKSVGRPPKVKGVDGRSAGRRVMSAAARAKISAAARARWAKVKGKTAAPAKAKATTAKAVKPKKSGGLTPEGRAKLAAAMKARWAARKKGAPALNAPAAK